MDTTLNEILKALPAQFLPQSLVGWITFIFAVSPLLGKFYKAMADGNGLVGGFRAFLFGSAHTVSCPQCGGDVTVDGASGSGGKILISKPVSGDPPAP